MKPARPQGSCQSREYYDKRYGANGWSTGFLVSVSIGQGEMLATPLQMCAFAAAIANDEDIGNSRSWWTSI